ncbi:hypothetical protein EJ071_37585 [Mesorhizobium sp. M1B.F.Ca.ET.045.04.1.1]|nr:hypothetical protein EJ071_37585 [Mesorhizobium sp. M1B.F.Ca.ET.045.04.1.1]
MSAALPGNVHRASPHPRPFRHARHQCLRGFIKQRSHHAVAAAGYPDDAAGAWLREGSHLDTATITGARVFVDGRAAAVLAGDLAQPIAEGAFFTEDIVADLTELAQGHPGSLNEIGRTVFKSTGLSQEDLEHVL